MTGFTRFGIDSIVARVGSARLGGLSTREQLSLSFEEFSQEACAAGPLNRPERPLLRLRRAPAGSVAIGSRGM